MGSLMTLRDFLRHHWSKSFSRLGSLHPEMCWAVQSMSLLRPELLYKVMELHVSRFLYGAPGEVPVDLGSQDKLGT